MGWDKGVKYIFSRNEGGCRGNWLERCCSYCGVKREVKYRFEIDGIGLVKLKIG